MHMQPNAMTVIRNQLLRLLHNQMSFPCNRGGPVTSEAMHKMHHDSYLEYQYLYNSLELSPKPSARAALIDF